MERGSESGEPQIADLVFLRLLHLADSALPIGAVPHSFGLETLVEAGLLTPPQVSGFLEAYLQEAGVMEAVFLREGFRLGHAAWFSPARWIVVNDRLGALKVGRESRSASAALGSRLLALVLSLVDSSVVRDAIGSTRDARTAVYHAPAFGLCAAVLHAEEETAASAFLHQSVSGLVSACQRLMPIGQSEATRIIWGLKPSIVSAVRRSFDFTPESVPCFLPVLDWGAMEHPALATRLFIS